MKKSALICLSFLLGTSLLAQTSDTWVSFWNKDTTLMGFKDKKGVVKIKPKFNGFTTANRFDNIIAVTEEKDTAWNSYYLTRNGKMVGRDSLYVFDNAPDCENEGFIRFHDRVTDQMGLFNKNGAIAVPAVYNTLSNVRNGMIVALTGATKIIMGEHHSWQGGKNVVIDTSNNVLIDDFKPIDAYLNFYSLLISPQPNTDSTRLNCKGLNEQYYSFVDYEKEFSSWLRSALLQQFTKASLLNCCNKKITYWKEKEGWFSEAKAGFVERNFELLKTKLLAIDAPQTDYNIFPESLNQFLYEGDEYRKYYDNCGQAKDWLYPVMNIVFSYYDKKDMVQDHFEFLRTENGYKLLSISVKKGKLK